MMSRHEVDLPPTLFARETKEASFTFSLLVRPGHPREKGDPLHVLLYTKSKKGKREEEKRNNKEGRKRIQYGISRTKRMEQANGSTRGIESFYVVGEAEHSIDSNFRPTRLRLCTRVRRSASSPPVPTPRAVAHSRTRAVAQVLGVAALLLSVRNGPAVFVLKRYLKWLKS
ncbi:unnamed protein product, partial [Cuscuta europaea]